MLRCPFACDVYCVYVELVFFVGFHKSGSWLQSFLCAGPLAPATRRRPLCGWRASPLLLSAGGPALWFIACWVLAAQHALPGLHSGDFPLAARTPRVPDAGISQGRADSRWPKSLRGFHSAVRAPDVLDAGSPSGSSRCRRVGEKPARRLEVLGRLASPTNGSLSGLSCKGQTAILVG